MPLPRLNTNANPLAGALALGSALMCLALWSGRVALERPREAQRPPRPTHRTRHFHRVAFQAEPLVQAREFTDGAGIAAAQDGIRVLLTKAVQEARLRVTCEADLLIINPDKHTVIARVPAGKVYSVSLSGDGRALAGPGGGDLPSTTIRILSLDASQPITIGARQYLGALEARVGDAGLEVINEVKREDYIAGVLAGESVRAFPLGALKAQAVAARTYAVSQLGHRPNGVDVVDTVADQVYRGVVPDWPELRQAAAETAGIVATYHDEPIVAYFSADCGGETRSNVDAGLGNRAYPYLRAVVDGPKGGPDYCSASPKHTWTQTLNQADILPKVNAAAGTHLASITDIRFSRVYADGRVGEVEISGLPMEARQQPTIAPAPKPEAMGGDATEDSLATPVEPAPEPALETVTLAGFEFRRAVGTNVLKSQIMSVAAASDGAWAFSGRGYGHGVGLCQWGACGMARAGIAFDAILKHYYSGIELHHNAPRAGSLEGIARDTVGQAAPGATVLLAGRNVQTTADKKGRFRFKNLPVATYDIVVVPKEGETAVSFAWRVEQR